MSEETFQWEMLALGRQRRTERGLVLAARDIHVWRIESPIAPHPRCSGADHAVRRERTSQSRAYARQLRLEILSAYAAAAQLSHDHGGRPLIGTGDLHMSASYTEGIALLALARRPVGIDVEWQREVVGADAIARSYFADAEYARWRAEPAPARQFLSYWTRKEAYLKALGLGFEHPARAVDASCGDGAGVIFNALDGFESLRWTVHSFRPSRGHIAALAHAREPGISYRWLTAIAT